jgi:hypothetical protein
VDKRQTQEAWLESKFKVANFGISNLVYPNQYVFLYVYFPISWLNLTYLETLPETILLTVLENSILVSFVH